jgi:benzil reductase ((S)-benzoin forming)
MRAVVLTGVSRGLGAALFERLQHRDERIFAIGRRFTPEQIAAREAAPHRITLFTADLADATALPAVAAIGDFVADASEAVLLHNAAVVGPIGAVGELSPDAAATHIAVNFSTPILLTNAFLAAAPPDVPVRVIFISSGAARRAQGGWSLYCATKAGAEMFFDATALQLQTRPGGATVVSFNPGQMDTGMQADLRRAAADGVYFPEADHYLERHAKGQQSDPGEIADRLLKEHLPDM